MARDLTTLDINAIHALLELLSPAMAHELVVDDSTGTQKPKRLSLANLAKLFAPYNNAVNDLNLGEHDITALRGFLDSLHLSTTPATIPTDIGAVYWDTDALTYSVVLPNGVTMQIGEESYVLVTRYSSAPNPILNGMPVYTVGESGQRPTVDVARADTKAKIRVTGIATHDIANQGRITTFGLVRSIPLARKPAGETWVAGNYLWLAPTGGMTNVEPSRPTPNVRLGLITNVTGSASFDMLVYVRPAMGMYDLYDVNGDAPDNHSVLEYDSVVGYFKKTNEPVFVKVTVGALISAFQKLASHTIPGSDDDILRLQNQQVGKPHSILEIRSPDTATTEATLSLHNVASGTNDWVFDLSLHNYSGAMKLVSVLSHFTGADAGSWEWWSRYTTGTDYDMIERQLMKLDGQTGYLGVGEALSPEARVHVKQSGWVDKPAMMIVMDSSHDSYPEGLYVKNDTNFASGGSLVRFKLVNVTDSATLLKLENAGSGDYINADDKFRVDKDGNITSPTTTALDGRLDTLEGRVDSTELTLARQGQDLASVKQTLQQGNGATLDFSGIGAVALDARATGRANPTVEGRTATQLLPDTDTWSGWSGIGSISDGWATKASSAGATGIISRNIGNAVEGHIYALIGLARFNSGFDTGTGSAFTRYGADSGAGSEFANISTGARVNGAILPFAKKAAATSLNAGGNGVIYFRSYSATVALSISWKATMLIDLTLTNETLLTEEQIIAKYVSHFAGAKSIQLPARVRSVGRNLCPTNPVEWELGSFNIATGELFASTTRIRTISYVRVNGGSAHKIRVKSTHSFVLYAYDANYAYLPSDSITAWASSTNYSYTPSSSVRYVKIAISLGLGGSTVISPSEISNAEFQIQVGAVATPYEPYDSTLYIADNEEVRSVPAIADKVLVQDGEWWRKQNVSNPSALASASVVSMYTAMTNLDWAIIKIPDASAVLSTSVARISVAGYPYLTGATSSAGNDLVVNIGRATTHDGVNKYIGIGFAKGTTLASAKTILAGTVILYQLATPIITPLITSGILQAKQNGTVYFEPYYEGSHQTNASSQITLPYEGTIDKLTGYDENLEPYEVPSTGYTLVGTLLTITGAEEHEVFYVELSRSEPLAPDMTINTLNNDQVTLDSVNGKYYKITHTTANGVPTTVATEVV